MAKLRKARPSTGSTASTSGEAPGSSPRRACSITSQSSSHHSKPPIALRSAAIKTAASVVAPSLDVSGEFTGIGHDSFDGGSAKFRSNSSTYSSDSISRSPNSTRRPSIPFGTHTSPSRNISSSSPALPPSSPSQPTIPFNDPSTTSTHEDSSGSALAQLRQKLDSDQHARQVIEKESHASSSSGGGHKLKKKRHGVTEEEQVAPPPNQEEATQTDGEEEEEGTEEVVVVETIVMEVVEETEEVLPEDVERGNEQEEDQEASNHFSTRTNTSSSTSTTPLPNSEVESEKKSTSLIGTGTSILFAPARLGWRVASGTVNFGVDTGKSVVRRVPIVGRLVPDNSTTEAEEEEQALKEEEEEESVSLPSPPSPSGSSLDSFAPSTASALQRNLPLSAPFSPLSTRASSVSSRSTLKPRMEQQPPVEEHGIVYKAAELSLGLGIASVLVTSALGKMAWRRVTTGSASPSPSSKPN
ncbi:hypothetical protein JCM16303_003952 [Sporobolomyces ruberrimus]